jgi:UDP-glucose 4-epimerase
MALSVPAMLGLLKGITRTIRTILKYLVTGGAGFIGSHLTDSLIQRGDSVIVLDDLSTGRFQNVSHLSAIPSFEFVQGSILNVDLVDDVVGRVDEIFHLAAAVGVNLIVEKPLESLSTNIRGSEVVLEKANKYGKPILVTSTSEIYGKNTSDSLREDDDRILGSPLKTRWSYSEAKAIEEVLAFTYWKTKGLPTRIVRLFNTVGPRQVGHYGMVVPRFIEAAISGKDITIYGDGKQTRCFGHIADIVSGILLVADTPNTIGKALNLGNTSEISIIDLAELIVSKLNSKSRIVFVPYDQAYEEGFEDMQRRVPNIQAISELTGWVPQIQIDQIISDVAADISQS